MSNALSMDLRERFVRLMGDGLNASRAGKILLLSRATAARWGKKVRDGRSMEPLPAGRAKGTGKLEPYVGFFIELIEQDPDMTLKELRNALYDAHGITSSISSVYELLRRHKYTYKKRSYRTGAQYNQDPQSAS